MSRVFGPKLLLAIVISGVFVLSPSISQTTYAQSAPFLITPYYGKAAINQGYSAGHPAYDYNLVYQPVLAAASGTVTRVRWYNDAPECQNNPNNSACGYGLHIYIQHSNGYVSRYGHLSATAFDLNTTNAPVSDGTVIGTSGNTGWSTGPHLHFEVKNASGGNTDPYNPSLWKDGEWAGHPLPAPANSGEIIVDDTSDNSGGFSKGSGGVFNNSCPPGSCPYWYRQTGIGYASDMYYTFVNGSVSDYWARWQPSIPAGGGNYEVFVYVLSNYATSWQAPLTVVHANGQVTARVDQDGLYKQWVSIGIYRMVPGNYVYITDGTGEGSGVHCGSGQWCQLGIDAVKFVKRDTLYQDLWRGDQVWSRNVPIINGAPQWGSSSVWVGPGSVGYMPGSGTLQTETYFVINNTLWHGSWRGNQGWSRTIPMINGQIQWASASNWSGPFAISSLPGSGDMQTQTSYVVGNTLWQGFWRGNQGWSRTVPFFHGFP